MKEKTDGELGLGVENQPAVTSSTLTAEDALSTPNISVLLYRLGKAVQEATGHKEISQQLENGVNLRFSAMDLTGTTNGGEGEGGIKTYDIEGLNHYQLDISPQNNKVWAWEVDGDAVGKLILTGTHTSKGAAECKYAFMNTEEACVLVKRFPPSQGGKPIRSEVRGPLADAVRIVRDFVESLEEVNAYETPLAISRHKE